MLRCFLRVRERDLHQYGTKQKKEMPEKKKDFAVDLKTLRSCIEDSQDGDSQDGDSRDGDLQGLENRLTSLFLSEPDSLAATQKQAGQTWGIAQQAQDTEISASDAGMQEQKTVEDALVFTDVLSVLHHGIASVVQGIVNPNHCQMPYNDNVSGPDGVLSAIQLQEGQVVYLTKRGLNWQWGVMAKCDDLILGASSLGFGRQDDALFFPVGDKNAHGRLLEHCIELVDAWRLLRRDQCLGLVNFIEQSQAVTAVTMLLTVLMKMNCKADDVEAFFDTSFLDAFFLVKKSDTSTTNSPMEEETGESLATIKKQTPTKKSKSPSKAVQARNALGQDDEASMRCLQDMIFCEPVQAILRQVFPHEGHETNESDFKAQMQELLSSVFTLRCQGYSLRSCYVDEDDLSVDSDSSDEKDWNNWKQEVWAQADATSGTAAKDSSKGGADLSEQVMSTPVKNLTVEAVSKHADNLRCRFDRAYAGLAKCIEKKATDKNFWLWECLQIQVDGAAFEVIEYDVLHNHASVKKKEKVPLVTLPPLSFLYSPNFWQDYSSPRGRLYFLGLDMDKLGKKINEKSAENLPALVARLTELYTLWDKRSDHEGVRPACSNMRGINAFNTRFFGQMSVSMADLSPVSVDEEIASTSIKVPSRQTNDIGDQDCSTLSSDDGVKSVSQAASKQQDDNICSPVFRGINYMLNRWTKAGRRAHVHQDQCATAHHSEWCLKESWPDQFTRWNDTVAPPNLADVQMQSAKNLVNVLSGWDRTAPWLVPHGNGCLYVNFGDFVQEKYSNGVDSCLGMLKTWFNSQDKALQDCGKAEQRSFAAASVSAGSVEHNKPEDYESPKSLSLWFNPFLSYSLGSRHALRYAIGEKAYYRAANHLPRYRDDGHVVYAHLGTLYIGLQQKDVAEGRQDVIHSPSQMNLQKRIFMNRRIGPEKEYTFLASTFDNKDAVCDQWCIKWPSIHKPWKNIYQAKYGMTRGVYDSFRKLFALSNPAEELSRMAHYQASVGDKMQASCDAELQTLHQTVQCKAEIRNWTIRILGYWLNIYYEACAMFLAGVHAYVRKVKLGYLYDNGEFGDCIDSGQSGNRHEALALLGKALKTQQAVPDHGRPLNSMDWKILKGTPEWRDQLNDLLHTLRNNVSDSTVSDATVSASTRSDSKATDDDGSLLRHVSVGSDGHVRSCSGERDSAVADLNSAFAKMTTKEDDEANLGADNSSFVSK